MFSRRIRWDLIRGNAEPSGVTESDNEKRARLRAMPKVQPSWKFRIAIVFPVDIQNICYTLRSATQRRLSDMEQWWGKQNKGLFSTYGGKKKLIKNTKKGSRIFIPFSFLPHVLSLSKWIENCLFKHVPPLSVFSFMWPHTQTPSVSSDSLPKQSRFLASVQIIYHAGGNLWF